MNKRIRAIANLIPRVKIVYDVGCDHALLSINLVQQLKAQHVVNFDINNEPLKAGLANVKRAKLESQISFVQNDGLKNYEPEERPDVVVVSGLGCQTIWEIVTNTPFSVNCWILQSNTFPNLLRKRMVEHGYTIIEEKILWEHHIAYEIDVFVKQKPWPYREVEVFFGPYNIQNKQLMWEIHGPKIKRLKTIQAHRNGIETEKEINWILAMEKNKWPVENS